MKNEHLFAISALHQKFIIALNGPIMRIMVISNLGLIRQTVEQSLHGEGHTIQTAETVPHAVEILRQHVNMDVIICEWAIRDQTAFDLYQQYRQIDRLSDHGEAPFPHFLVFEMPGRLVARTTAPVKRDVKAESLIALGCAEFLDKPIDRRMLRERIREIEIKRGGTLKPVPVETSAVESSSGESLEEVSRQVAPAANERLNALKVQLRRLDEQFTSAENQLNDVRGMIAEILKETCLVETQEVLVSSGSKSE